MQPPDSINNVRLGDIDTLEPEELESYSLILPCLKPIPKLGKYKARDFYKMEFAEVVNIREAVKADDMIEAVRLYYNVPPVFMVSKRIIEFSHAQNYMIRQLEIINTREEKELYSEPDQNWVEAGIRELDRYGALNVLDRLGMEFGKSPEEIETWSYGLVFWLLSRRATQARINERHREITKNKK